MKQNCLISYLIKRCGFHADCHIEEDFENLTAEINFLVIELPLSLLSTTQRQIKHFYQVRESMQLLSKSRPDTITCVHTQYRHRMGGMKSGVSCFNGSTVSRVRCARDTPA